MEPIAPVASATARRLAALGTGVGGVAARGLNVGQIVQARVAGVDGNQVRLQLGEQLLNATSRVPLTLGQQVSLMVEQNASGKTLLRMVDGTLGRSRPSEDARSGQQSGPSAPIAGGRQGPVAPVPGRTGHSSPQDQQGAAGQRGHGSPGNGASNGNGMGLPGAPLSRMSVGLPSQGAAPGSQPAGQGVAGATGQPRPPAGFSPGGPSNGSPTGRATAAGQQIGTPWVPGSLGLPGLAGSAEALATLLFTRLDGGPAGTAPRSGPGIQAAPWQTAQTLADSTAEGATGSSGSQTAAMPRQGQQAVADGATGLAAKAAMPTYGRLAQSVGGAVAFGQLLATHTPEINHTLARASLAPTDLGRLLVDVGVHPDEMNAVLVGELLAQGETVHEGSVRRLRRELAAAGGSLRDAAPAVALARLGLPITPLSLAVARQLQAGQLAPGAAWGELLATMRELTQGPMSGSQAGVLAAELLADWRVPLEEGAAGIACWLQRAVDQAGTPLEAKLARPMAGPSGDQSPSGAHTSPGQDVRARLDLLAQALPSGVRGPRGELASSLASSLQRVQATVQGEQLLNGSMAAPAEQRSEPRFFAVTLPTVMGQQLSTLEMRVKERDARPSKPGEPGRPDVVQLKLSLPGLGDLSVNLTVGQHSVACHFSTATPFAEALLTASSSELVGRLKRLGYGHTTVDAAHEPPSAARQPLKGTPRLHQVDLHA